MAKRTNTKPAPNAAVIYCRVSTDEQAEHGVSLDAQEAALRAYCTMRGLEVVEVVVDAGVSAGKALATRAGGARVLDLVRRRHVAAVVAYKLDRLFRDCADCLAVTRAWDAAEVALHLVEMGGQAIDTSTAMGRFFLTVMAGAAEMERNLIRERTAAAMAHKRARREFCGGEPPYGWTLAADGRMIEPNAAEQRVLVAARELRGAGGSLRKVGAELELRGMLPRRGGHWHPKTIGQLLKAEVAA